MRHQRGPQAAYRKRAERLRTLFRRAWIAPFLFFFLSACALIHLPSAGGEFVVEATSVELLPGAPDQKQLGALTFLSGFELRGNDARFGGISGLSISADGREMHAISDRGYWVSALLRHDDEGRLTGFDGWRIGVLLNTEGQEVRGLERDAEGLARDRDGSFIVSFEQLHRLWRYPPPPAAFKAPARPLPVPADLAGAPNNGGIEGIAVLPDGKMLIITEEYENPDGSVKGWLLEEGRFDSVSYVPSEGFRLTDMATLANGDILVLERRYALLDNWAARIKRVSREGLRAGARLVGAELARLDPPLLVDNYEGMAVREDPKAGTLLYIISDDNYSPLQRTLLLQFRLEPAS